MRGEKVPHIPAQYLRKASVDWKHERAPVGGVKDSDNPEQLLDEGSMSGKRGEGARGRGGRPLGV